MSKQDYFHCCVSPITPWVADQTLTDANRHRLSTIMNADNILVVMDGEIVESGTHHELVNSKGRYYNLWSKQITPIAATGSSNGATTVNDENTLIVDVEVAPQTAKSDNGVQRGGGQTASGAELADATNRLSTRPRNTPAKNNIEEELVNDQDLISKQRVWKSHHSSPNSSADLSRSVDRSNTAATDECNERHPERQHEASEASECGKTNPVQK